MLISLKNRRQTSPTFRAELAAENKMYYGHWEAPAIVTSWNECRASGNVFIFSLCKCCNLVLINKRKKKKSIFADYAKLSVLSFRGMSQHTLVPCHPNLKHATGRAWTAPAVFCRHTAQEQHKDEKGLTATHWDQSQLYQPSVIHQKLLERQLAHKTDLGCYIKCSHQIFFLMNYIKNTSINAEQVYLIHMCKATCKRPRSLLTTNPWKRLLGGKTQKSTF